MIRITLIFLFCIHGALFGQEQEASLPNVIFVIADDLGIGDVSPTNPDCKIKTPNLQAMADEGITFLDANSPASVSTPTLYGVVTGRYSWRSRLAKGVLRGTSDHLIPAERETVAHLLQRAGYDTQMIGKWHLGWDWAKIRREKAKRKTMIDFTKPVKNGPDINGFDGYYGHCGPLDMPPYVWVDTGRITAIPELVRSVSSKVDPYGWFRRGAMSPDFDITEVLPHLFGKSIDHIEARAKEAKQGKPFFLYFSLPAPHTPIIPTDPFKNASGINPYADFVMQIDHHMGEMFATLKEAGIDDNTLVFFTSNNGCSPEANFAALSEHGHDPSAGYRGHKADIFEGGHRVPLIVRWPDMIEGGKKTHALASLNDFYATMRDITDQPERDDGGEDSFSWMPVFNGDPETERKTLIGHSVSGAFSFRKADWKLCLSAGSGGWSAPREPVAKKQKLPAMQLYNLKNDPGEESNRLNDHPEKVKELLTLLNEDVTRGRSTPGKQTTNDRTVNFLPEGVSLPDSK